MPYSKMPFLQTTLFFVTLFPIILAQVDDSPLIFQDMMERSGLLAASPRRSAKFGGPCVADIDSDGIYDFILNYHNVNHTRIYLGRGDGRFSLFINPITGFPFRPRTLDNHGVAVAQLSARSRDRLITFSVGGGRGRSKRSPGMYIMSPDRSFRDVTNDLGFGQIVSRPRNVLFMDMQLKRNGRRRRDGGGPDTLNVNFLHPRNGSSQFAYRNIRGRYSLVEDIGDFANYLRGSVEVTDINGDGVMEVVAIEEFKFYRLTAPFQLNEVTASVLPPGFRIPTRTASAVAEIDFDNDGDFDLFVARSESLDRRPPFTNDTSDLLLRNDGGRYTDVSVQAGIPRNTKSLGCTVGDFNNDGFADILVVQLREADFFLLNNGDGTFRRVNGLIPRDSNTLGNHAVAVDYDMDGRVDAMVGHGGRTEPNLGRYLLMKNMMVLTKNNHYLHVTVYNDRSLASTSLHAVVTVFLPGRRRIIRRVGGSGSQDSIGTYLDTVHFGLGSVTRVNRVRVRWSSGLRENKRRVAVDQRVLFGVR